MLKIPTLQGTVTLCLDFCRNEVIFDEHSNGAQNAA